MGMSVGRLAWGISLVAVIFVAQFFVLPGGVVKAQRVERHSENNVVDVTILFPRPNMTIASDEKLSLDFKASSRDGTPLMRYEVFVDNVKGHNGYYEIKPTVEIFSDSLDVSGINQFKKGSHYIKVVVYDAKNRKGGAIVKVFKGGDFRKPVVRIMRPQAGDVVHGDTVVVVHAEDDRGIYGLRAVAEREGFRSRSLFTILARPPKSIVEYPIKWDTHGSVYVCSNPTCKRGFPTRDARGRPKTVNSCPGCKETVGEVRWYPDGVWTLRAIARDLDGNEAEDRILVHVENNLMRAVVQRRAEEGGPQPRGGATPGLGIETVPLVATPVRTTKFPKSVESKRAMTDSPLTLPEISKADISVVSESRVEQLSEQPDVLENSQETMKGRTATIGDAAGHGVVPTLKGRVHLGSEQSTEKKASKIVSRQINLDVRRKMSESSLTVGPLLNEVSVKPGSLEKSKEQGKSDEDVFTARRGSSSHMMQDLGTQIMVRGGLMSPLPPVRLESQAAPNPSAGQVLEDSKIAGTTTVQFESREAQKPSVGRHLDDLRIARAPVSEISLPSVTNNAVKSQNKSVAPMINLLSLSKLESVEELNSSGQQVSSRVVRPLLTAGTRIASLPPTFGGVAMPVVAGASSVVTPPYQPRIASTPFLDATQPVVRVERAKSITYIVARLETLMGLSRKFGISPKVIAKMNELEDDSWLREGQELVIPRAPVYLRYDGNPIATTVTPFDRDDVGVGPFREVSEFAGWEVGWEHKTKRAWAVGKERQVSLTIGNELVKVDGDSLKLRVAPFLLSHRAFVPLRLFELMFDAEVNYDRETGIVDIRDPGVVK